MDASQSAARLSAAMARANEGGAVGRQGSAAACTLMTQQAQEELLATAKIAAGPRAETESCGEALSYLLDRSRLRGRASRLGGKVIDVKVRGTLATVRLEAPDGKRSTLTLAKEKSRWKLAASG